MTQLPGIDSTGGSGTLLPMRREGGICTIAADITMMRKLAGYASRLSDMSPGTSTYLLAIHMSFQPVCSCEYNSEIPAQSSKRRQLPK